MSRISISHINNRHTDWLRAIDFYTQELDILKNRLTELAGKNTSAVMMPEVEHYENQLRIQKDQLQQLQHNIKQHVASIADQAQKSSAGYIEDGLLTQHEELEASYQQEENIINQLRQEFNRFAAQWM